MMAVFQLRFLQKYKVEVCHVTGGKVCEPMAEGWKKLLANGRVGEISATNSRGREEMVFRDNSEREGCNCEQRRMSERRKIYELRLFRRNTNILNI